MKPKLFEIKIGEKTYKVRGCPFCGKKPRLLSGWDGFALDCECHNCDGTIKLWDWSLSRLVRHWNMRKG